MQFRVLWRHNHDVNMTCITYDGYNQMTDWGPPEDGEVMTDWGLGLTK